MEIQIPFAGFYYSIHDDECNREIESLIDYFAEETGCDIPQKLADRLSDSVNWSDVRATYAQEYVKSFLDNFEIEGKPADSVMSSPKWYNFETDRVFANITRNAVAKLWRETDRDALDRIARERFTSCDGFISYYRPDWREWGRLSEWDHNQLGTLLLAWLDSQYDEFDQFAELDLMESFNCNGGLLNAMYESEKFCDAMRVYDYLIERARRPVKNMTQWRLAFTKPWESTPLGAVNHA